MTPSQQTTSPATERVAPIPQAIRDIEHSLHTLHISIGRLEERARLIIQPPESEPPACVSECKSPHASHSEVLRHLTELHNMSNTAIRRIDSVIDAMEI